MHIHYVSRNTDACGKKTLAKAEVLTQLIYSSQSKKVQALKCTHSIKVKSFPLKDISVAISVPSYMNLTSDYYNAKTIKL